MRKQEIELNIKENKKIRAAIYVASDFLDACGKNDLAMQLKVIKSFTDLHSNIEVVGTYMDCERGVRSLTARLPYIAIRDAIDSGKCDMVIVSSLEFVMCGIANSMNIMDFAKDTEICILAAGDSYGNTLTLYDRFELLGMKKKLIKHTLRKESR